MDMNYRPDSQPKTSVLVTAIGTLTATCILKALKGMENLYLIGTDINERENIVSSMDVMEYYVFPSVIDDTESYYQYFRQFCVLHSIQYAFCVIDEEVLLLSDHRAELELLGVRVCIPNADAVRLCHFKDVFSRWMEQNYREYAIRSYRGIQDIRQYPVFIKPIEGRASIGCRRVETQDELLAFLDKDMLIQEYIQGRVIVADVFRSHTTGQYGCLLREELLRNGNGCGIAVVMIEDKRVSDFCESFAERICLNGVINIEFFVTDTYVKVIEVNPRFSAGTIYTCMSGLNIVKNALLIAQGLECEPVPEGYIGKRFARRYETYEME